MAVLEGGMEGLSACECPVCFLFLSEERLPMSMPCGHTLCKVCIDELASQSHATVDSRGQRPRPTFPCPLCRQWVNIDSVSLNVTLRDLLSELTRLQGRKPVPVGTSLNVNYSEIDLGEQLDRGAFGEVYHGRWRGESVAIKMFASGQMTPEGLQAFQREVFVMNCLRHPNVVLLMGACQTPPRLAIIMEYVAGGSLYKVIHIDKVRLTNEQVAKVGVDICRGLQYLHSINVMHRDLKSKNILLTGKLPCSAKLCDFGLARMRQETATMTGNVGTVHWTAPEILNNIRYQFSADVYSFGMVLYEMVCGRIPFQSMIPMAVMVAVVVNRKQPDIPATILPVLAELIRECIQWEPESRPSIAGALSSLATLLPSRSLPGDQPSQHRPLLSHQDSLGVVFVSVSDSSDLANQSNDLEEFFQGMENEEEVVNKVAFEQALPPPKVSGGEGEEELDLVLAQTLQHEANKQLLESDQELAQQLQLREHTFLAPKDNVQTTSKPPRHLLDSITSGSVPQLKAVSKTKKKAVSPMASRMGKSPSSSSPPLTYEDSGGQEKHGHLRTKLSDLSRKVSSHHSSKKERPSTTTETVPSKFSLPRKSRASPESSIFQSKTKGKPAAKSSFPAPSAASNRSTTSKMSSLLHGKVGARKKAASPSVPVAPPPPPLPPTLSPSYNPWHSRRQQMLQQVRMLAPAVGKNLRRVETVEKRAFRVGHVVGDHDPSRADFSLTKLIGSFSKRNLRPVETKEPPPAYPVGKVVTNRQGRVKRMSSLIETGSLTNRQASFAPHLSDPGPESLPPSTPRKRLHPKIQSAIAEFKRSRLHHVIPEVKVQLPDTDTIAMEREKLFLDEIHQFQSSWLRPTETEVKNSLPTGEAIAMEKAELEKEKVLPMDVCEDIQPPSPHQQLNTAEELATNELPGAAPSPMTSSPLTTETSSTDKSVPKSLSREDNGYEGDIEVLTNPLPQIVDTSSDSGGDSGPPNLQKTLMDAVKRGNLQKVQEAHMKGAKLTVTDSQGWTPLLHAARLGKKEVVVYLTQNIPREALDIVEDEKLQTALHKAAWFGYQEICEILVQRGASLSRTDYQGNTPYLKSIQSEDVELQAYLKRKEE